MSIIVKYGDYTFRPSPKVNIETTTLDDKGGSALGHETTISLDGFLSVSGGTKWGLPPNQVTAVSLLEAASGLQSGVIANNYKTLQIGGGLYNNAVVESINFQPSDNYWSDTLNYSIQLKTLLPARGGNQPYLSGVTDVSDSLTIEDIDDFYPAQTASKITRTISANGRQIGVSGDALYAARAWVSGQIYNNDLYAPYAQNLYNRERKLDIDPSAGKFGITESFIYKTGEPWFIDMSTSVSHDNQAFLMTLKVNGTIQGFEPASGISHNDPIFSGKIIQVNGIWISEILPSGKNQIMPIDTGNLNMYSTINSTNAPPGVIAANCNATEIKYKLWKEAKDSERRTLVSPDPFKCQYAFGNALAGYDHFIEKDYLGHGSHMFQLATGLVPYADPRNGGSLSENDMSKYTPNKIGQVLTHMNKTPISSSYAEYPRDGKITFEKTFNSRPAPYFSGAITETINFSTRGYTDRVKEFKIIGRKLGPIVYNYYNSPNAGNFTVTYEAVFPKPTGLKGAIFPVEIIMGLDNYLESFAPSTAEATGVLVQDSEKWNPVSNRIVKTKSWDYVACG